MARDDGGALTWRADVDASQPLAGGAVAEFVITDGRGDWDKSPSGENYMIFEAGSYELRDGALVRMDG
jgi:hypothetical protein